LFLKSVAQKRKGPGDIAKITIKAASRALPSRPPEVEFIFFTALSADENALLSFINHHVDLGAANVASPAYRESLQSLILATHRFHLFPLVPLE
jgi:hypothetical protein